MSSVATPPHHLEVFLVLLLEKHAREIKDYEDQIQCLKGVINNLPGSIYWKDKDGIYLGNNCFAAEKMRSIGLCGDVTGKTDYDLFDKQVADGFRENDLVVMEKNEMFSSEETTTLADGTKVVQTSIKKPLRDTEGNVIGVVGNTIDITELKIQVEENLKLAKEQAERSDQIKTQFIQNMEHDIRTPFTGIWALSTKLFKSEEDIKRKEFLGAMVSCSKELLDYCNSIIDLVHSDNQLYPNISKKFDLNRLIQKVIQIESPPAMHKQIPLLFEYPPSIPKIWVGDPHRLKRILINLLSNAIKFTKKGYVQISVNVIEEPSSSENNKRNLIRIYIKDTGIGIPAEKSLHIYEKFYRGTPSNHAIYKGMGLGLSVVKQLVEDMEGEVEFTSKIDEGSTFLITIPLYLPLVHDLLEEKEEENIYE